MKHLPIFALAIALAACGGKKKAADVTVADTCKVENDQKEVELSGFLYMPLVADPCTAKCSVELADVSDYTDKPTMSLYVPVGTGALTMKALVPKTDSYMEQVGPDAFTVVDSDGKTQKVGARVIVKGKVEVQKKKVDDGMGKMLDVTICTMTPASIHGV